MGIWESQAGGSSSGVELGETSTTAYRGDRGKTAYDHSQISHIDYHGIEAAGALSFDNSTHILTIASGTNTYWFQGTKFTTASAITCDLDSFVTLTANTQYYVYFDDATGTLKASASIWSLKTKVPVATVYWNGSAGAVCKETHNHIRDLDWHTNAHLTIGARYYNGLGLTKPTTTDDALLDIASGIIYDEDLAINITNPTTSRVWYLASADKYTFEDSSLPYAGTSGVPKYLDTDTYTLQAIGAGKYACMFIYATSDIARPIYIIPTAAATDLTLANARAAAPPALAGFGLTPEMKLLYKFIYTNGDFVEATDYRTSASLPSGFIASTTASSVSFTASGNIAATNVQTALEEIDTEKVSATGSDGQLSRQMLIDCGMTFLDKGNSSTTTQTLDYTAGSHQKITATGNFTIALSNFPPSGNLGELLLELVNGGAYTITLPTVNWIKPDGTTTTSISDYLTANVGRTALQTSGTDFILLFSRDGGTTVYGGLV